MFKVITDFPVAIDSIDHIHPHGTANDNSRWHPFNDKLYKLASSIWWKPDIIQILDLGCSGGGFVKDCIDDGHIAIGLEGSNYSKNLNRAEWATIPNNLFTCDVTKPFIVATDNEAPYLFDFITGWELLEHLPADRLGQFLANCDKHLAQGGKMIFSISPDEEFWHVTVKERSWWLDLFDKHGFVNRDDLVTYFGDDWIRGPKQGAPRSHHVVLERKNA